MISELLDPLNAREKLSSYIDLLLATYPSVRGYLAPSELKWSSSELNIRDPSWRAKRGAEQEVAEVDMKSEIWNPNLV
jgi:hypothetical protein